MSLMTREDMLRELELLPVWQLKTPLPNVSGTSALPPVLVDVIESVTLLSPVPAPELVPAEPVLLESILVESVLTEADAVELSTIEATLVESNLVEANVAETSAVEEPLIENKLAENVCEQVTTPAAPFRLLVSDESGMAFVLDNVSTDAQDVEALLSNMLKAINLNCNIDLTEATVDTLAEHAVRLLVVMGEAVANSVIGVARTVDDWRATQANAPLYYQDLPVVVTYHPAFLLKNKAYKAKAWVDLCAAKRILQSQ